MTVLNFPDTSGKPTDGSFIYVANGVTYTWDGDKWTSEGQGSNPPDVRTGNLQEVTDLGNTTTNGITADGNINCGNDVAAPNPTERGISLTAGGELYLSRPNTSGLIYGYRTGEAGVKFKLSNDGTAEFAGTGLFGKGKSGETVSTNDALSIETNNASGKSRGFTIYGNSDIPSTYEAFQIRGNGSPVISAKYDGSISAAGSIDCSDAIASDRSSSSSNAFAAKLNGSVTATITNGGSIKANGEIITPSSYPGGSNSPGAKILPIGMVQAAASSGFLWQGYTVGNASQTSSISHDGNATFAGNVTADNVNFSIDNGATLDVKRVGKALVALKTAAAAASDFASLKSAIATALAEI